MRRKIMGKTSQARLDAVRKYRERYPDRVRETHRKVREKRRAKGLCLRCATKAVLGKSSCTRHLKYAAQKMSAKRLSNKMLVLETYGGPKCVCCGEKEPVFLTVDHIHGNGSAHRNKVTNGFSGSPFYRWLIRQGFPPGFQVLCHNCNHAKHILGECPHRKRKKKHVRT